MTPSDVLKLIKDNKIIMVDFRFIDWVGTWQHVSIPASTLEADTFEKGFAFDGSSIRGWQAINNSDMLMIPDPSSARIDPFYAHPTLVLICDIADPLTLEPYSRDPRYIARKALNFMKSTGIADKAFFGPELEFFIFNNIRFENGPNISFVEVDSDEGHWNSGSEGMNLGHRPRFKEGYFPVPPVDSLQDIRTEMMLKMQQVGIPMEVHHHEVATAGQCEIGMKFDELINKADQVCWFKYVVKNVAKQHNMTATFMPKPLFGDNGSGMHVHSSLWRGDKPLFPGDGYAGLSKEALYYIGGILKHAPSLLAITNPLVNSYRRLVPGFEAPVNLAYSARNRSASIRIPVGQSSPKARRVEFRCPDAGANPYLAFSAILMAGIDGIRNKIDPGAPLDKNIYDLAPEEKKGVPNTPGSLDEAINNLEKDHKFLTEGGVFTQDAIDGWISYKREHEITPIQLRPTPMEFQLYYDI